MEGRERGREGGREERDTRKETKYGNKGVHGEDNGEGGNTISPYFPFPVRESESICKSHLVVIFYLNTAPCFFPFSTVCVTSYHIKGSTRPRWSQRTGTCSVLLAVSSRLNSNTYLTGVSYPRTPLLSHAVGAPAHENSPRCFNLAKFS